MFPTTNNESQYEGLTTCLRLVPYLEVSVINIFSDPELAIKHVQGEFKTINEKLAAYMQVTSKLLQTFASWTINNIDRSVNQWVYALSKLAISDAPKLSDPYMSKRCSIPLSYRGTSIV